MLWFQLLLDSCWVLLLYQKVCWMRILFLKFSQILSGWNQVKMPHFQILLNYLWFMKLFLFSSLSFVDRCIIKLVHRFNLMSLRANREIGSFRLIYHWLLIQILRNNLVIELHLQLRFERRMDVLGAIEWWIKIWAQTAVKVGYNLARLLHLMSSWVDQISLPVFKSFRFLILVHSMMLVLYLLLAECHTHWLDMVLVILRINLAFIIVAIGRVHLFQIWLVYSAIVLSSFVISFYLTIRFWIYVLCMLLRTTC